MSTFTPNGRKQFITEFCLKPAFVNLVLSAAAGWMVYRSTAVVPFWGEQGIAADLVITTFIVAVLTYPITRGLVRAQLRTGRLRPFTRSELRDPLRLFPKHVLFRSLFLALGSVLFLAAPVVLAGSLLRIEAAGFIPFLPLKAAFAAAVAAITGPLSAVSALVDATAEGQQAPI